MDIRADGLELLIHQVRPLDPFAERLPELRLQRTECDMTVGARVRAITDERAGQGDVAPLGRLALEQALSGRHPEPREGSVEHRDVDELPLARVVTRAQRSEDPERGHQRAATDVGDLPRVLHRWTVGLAGHPEQADRGPR